MTQPAAAAGANGLYLYAIAPRADRTAKWAEGFSSALYLVERGPFAAIVQDAAYGSLPGGDREVLAKLLIAHQQVVQDAMSVTPVLPVKFATIAPNRESIERCLENGRAAFADALASLQGKTQYEVLVTWDLKAVFAEIAADPEVARLKTEMARAPRGATADDSAHLGAIVKNRLEARRSTLGKTLAHALQAAAIDAIVNPLMDDRMVLNLALLVDTDDALQRRLESLDAAHDGKLTFRCVGPLPPHSFATVEIDFLDGDRIARARDMLELDGAADAEAVRAAYRRLAKEAHPDLAGDRVGTERIRALRDAYDTLSSFVDAGNSVIVSVRRQEAAFAAEAA